MASTAVRTWGTAVIRMTAMDSESARIRGRTTGPGSPGMRTSSSATSTRRERMISSPLAPSARLEDLEVVLEDEAQRVPHARLVVDDEHDRARWIRRRTEARQPARPRRYRLGSGTVRTTYSLRPPPRWR